MPATCKRCLVLPTCLLLLCSHMAPQMSAGLLSCSPFDSPTDRLITVYPTSLAPSWLRLVLPHLNIWGAGRKYLVHSNPLSGRRFYYLCWFSAIPAWPFCYVGHLRINLWEEVSTLCVVAQFHVVSCLATTKTFRVTSFLAMSCTTGLETKRKGSSSRWGLWLALYLFYPHHQNTWAWSSPCCRCQQDVLLMFFRNQPWNGHTFSITDWTLTVIFVYLNRELDSQYF